jgi:hypothetical protein
MPGMLPDSPLSAKQRKVVLVTGATSSCATGFFAMLHSFPDTFSLVVMAALVLANASIACYAWPASDGFLVRPARDKRTGGRNGISRGHGGHGGHGGARGAGLAPPMAGRWPVLRAVSRLMPRAAGRRWLAEAESLLFEAPAGRRRTIIRSYLRSAPRLALAMWAAELARRARLRFRRPG